MRKTWLICLVIILATPCADRAGLAGEDSTWVALGTGEALEDIRGQQVIVWRDSRVAGSPTEAMWRASPVFGFERDPVDGSTFVRAARPDADGFIELAITLRIDSSARSVIAASCGAASPSKVGLPDLLRITLEPRGNASQAFGRVLRERPSGPLELRARVPAEAAPSLVADIKSGAVAFTVTYELAATEEINQGSLTVRSHDLRSTDIIEDIMGTSVGTSVSEPALTMAVSRHQRNQLSDRAASQLAIKLQVNDQTVGTWLRELVEEFFTQAVEEHIIGIDDGPAWDRLNQLSFARQDLKPSELNKFATKVRDDVAAKQQSTWSEEWDASASFLGVSVGGGRSVTGAWLAENQRHHSFELSVGDGKVVVPKAIRVDSIRAGAFSKRKELGVYVTRTSRAMRPFSFDIRTDSLVQDARVEGVMSAIPVGTVLPFWGAFPDVLRLAGWEPCDGTVPDIPDLRGCVPIGSGAKDMPTPLQALALASDEFDVALRQGSTDSNLDRFLVAP
ncbi:MAG: hypothetical protein KDA37_07790, partial [Planctomycetales bacterium]|nr:hypothetical protein [Planctomycetales bacterium]